MAKKIEPKIEKTEREYIIPLREKCRVVARYKKTPKAVKTIKEFLVRHMKIRDRDLKKIKLDKTLNEILWRRGIKNPPHKIKVKVIKEADIVRVEAVDIPEKFKFKKLRLEKREKLAQEVGAKKKSLVEKAKETKDKPIKGEEKPEESKEEKEKSKAGKETDKQTAKTEAKTAKQQKIKTPKQPKRPQRKALAK